jgi:hypothetical protein
VLFLHDVTLFKTNFVAGSESSTYQARKILEEYIVRGSPLEINITSGARRLTLDALNQGLTREDFHHAEKEVSDMVTRDSLRKWHDTEQFRAALQEATSKNPSSGNRESKHFEDFKSQQLEMSKQTTSEMD